MHILGEEPLGKENLILLFRLADRLRYLYTDNLLHNKKYLKEILSNRIVALLFLEPSSRTRVSFELAAKILGAETITLEGNLSTKKGETLEDTIRTLADFPGISAIVLRHSQRGAAKIAVETLEKMHSKGLLNHEVSIINAGDGNGWHPTQAYLDLYTLWRHNKLYDFNDKKDRLCGAIFGDLAQARVIHSLILEISPWRPKLYLIGPEGNNIPYGLYKKAKTAGVKIIKKTIFDEEVSKEAQFYYFVRLQAERYSKNPEDVVRLQKEYNQKYGCSFTLRRFARSDAIFLHPGPMLKEIPQTARWDDPRFVYDKQIENGLWIRAALLKLLLNPNFRV